MVVNSTQLRSNIYQILDEVLRTGEPVEIVRNGKKLRIVADAPPEIPRMQRLKKRKGVYTGDAADLVGIGWADSWTGA